MKTIEDCIHGLLETGGIYGPSSAGGLRINVFATQDDQWQASVSDSSGKTWSVEVDIDPVKAVEYALRGRLHGHGPNVPPVRPSPPSDEIEDLLG